MVLCYLNNKISLGLIAPPLNLKIENQKFSIFLENGKSFCLYVQIMKREPKSKEKYLITQPFSQTYEHTKENYFRNGKPPLSLCLLCVSFVMICVTYIVQRRDISGQKMRTSLAF